jgi:hypothetical protein
MKLSTHLEDALAHVEHQFNCVSDALVSGEPLALEAASIALRQAAMDFSVLMQRLTPADLKNKDLKTRLKKIVDGMAIRRESLIRRTAMVERALSAVVPASGNNTYSPNSSPYGSAGKQSGAFKYLSA